MTIQCCLCGDDVEVQRNSAGDVVWDQGHNPEPVMAKEGARCCQVCNDVIVTPTRLALTFSHVNSQGGPTT